LVKTIHTGRYRIGSKSHFQLNKYSPDDTSGFEGDKQDEPEESERLNDKLQKLQDKLWAEHDPKILIILQAMDTGGKDGVIHRVFQGVNPQGVRVVHFGPPSIEELDHDFLWRVHKQVPGKGEMVIFNRSHYEGVLVERVDKLVPKKIWQDRYNQILDFEKLLFENETLILKFFLHISKDEQKKRLQARLHDPEKEWKFSMNDLPERKYWHDYMKAYEEAISRTSTENAPWYVIPANHKWYRDLLVSQVLVKNLEELHLEYPKPMGKHPSLPKIK
jgi:PPK2 family polyphosphate:nucleotide phosphotransferase